MPVDVHREERHPLGTRLFGSERGIAGIAAEHAVHRSHDGTELAQVLHAAVALFESVERELPRVASVGDEALGDREGCVECFAAQVDPSHQLRRIGEPVRTQEPQHLQLRIDPRFETPEQLQDDLVVDQQR